MDLGIAPPVMKNFKEFLLSLEDSVDETEAVKRYNDYKLDFRRQQMQNFFVAHKDEEWYVSRGLGCPPRRGGREGAFPGTAGSGRAIRQVCRALVASGFRHRLFNQVKEMLVCLFRNALFISWASAPHPSVVPRQSSSYDCS